MPSIAPVALSVIVAVPRMNPLSVNAPQDSPQLAPQPLNDDAIYGPHSFPGAPVPTTSTSLTLAMFTFGGLAFMAAMIDASVNTPPLAVLPLIQPTA